MRELRTAAIFWVVVLYGFILTLVPGGDAILCAGYFLLPSSHYSFS